MNKRPVWPDGKRAKILGLLDVARTLSSISGKRGRLTKIYRKYAITPQHEAQWRKAA